MEVEEVIHTKVPEAIGQELQFMKIGGALVFPEGVIVFQENSPPFHIGERYVLFLRKEIERDVWDTTFGPYGRMVVKPDGRVSPLVDVHAEFNNMDLDEFIRLLLTRF